MSQVVKTRIQNKYDKADNWANASFVPLRGELIVYGDETTTDAPLLKIGDGIHTIGELPFCNDLAILRGVNENSYKTNFSYVDGDGTFALGYDATASTDNSIALGSAAQAGAKGCYFAGIDNVNKIIYLTTLQPSYNDETGEVHIGGIPVVVGENPYGESEFTQEQFDALGWETGDVISVINGPHFDFCATITEIGYDNSNVTFSQNTAAYIKYEVNNESTFDLEIKISGGEGVAKENATGWDKFSVRVPNKPACGPCMLTADAIALGQDNKAAGDNAFAEGYSTQAGGSYSHAEGVMTKAAYAAHAEGFKTQALKEQSHAEGYSTTTRGVASHAEGSLTTASGLAAHAEGQNTKATEYASHAEGNLTEANGSMSHAEGDKAKTTGAASHAEGSQTEAKGKYSHAEGELTDAVGIASHSEGNNTFANGNYSHTEGLGTSTATNAMAAHAEGQNSKATAQIAHAEGYGTTASGDYSHSEGLSTTASNAAAHAEGRGNTASGTYAHAEGAWGTASGSMSHSEGNSTQATGESSHAEGQGGSASGVASHKEGINSTAKGSASHAEGESTKADGSTAHAEGYGGSATGTAAHKEGRGAIANGEGAHAEGRYTQAHGTGAHAEGVDSVVGAKNDDGSYATAWAAHAEGQATNATTTGAHAEGVSTVASGTASHAEGEGAKATAATAHAEGKSTQANGYASHAEGQGTIAHGPWQHVEGRYNIEDTEDKYAHIIGNGNGGGATDRKNAYTVDWQGNVWAAGNIANEGNLKTNRIEAYHLTTTGIDNGEGHIATKTLTASATIATDGNMIAQGEISASQMSTPVLNAETINLNGKPLELNSKLTIWETDVEGVNLVRPDDLTSPMYALNQLFTPTHPIYSTTENIVGNLIKDGYGNVVIIDSYDSYSTTLTISEFLDADIFNIVYLKAADGDYTDINRYAAQMRGNTASGQYAVAEGHSTLARGTASHSEGEWSVAYSDYAHAEGWKGRAFGSSGHAEGHYTTARGQGAHSEGVESNANGQGAHVEGVTTVTYGTGSHAEGVSTRAGSGTFNPDSGEFTVDMGILDIDEEHQEYPIVGAHAEGMGSVASGIVSHAEGYNTYASGSGSHAEGNSTRAIGEYSHAEGKNSEAIGNRSHAEGVNTRAYGRAAHAEGVNSIASGQSTHAEGSDTIAAGVATTDEDGNTVYAEVYAAHAEGDFTEARASFSHAEGQSTHALARWSHAEGYRTVAASEYQHVSGRYNVEDANNEFAYIIGNGHDEPTRSNAMTVSWDGDLKVAGTITDGQGNVLGNTTGSTAGVNVWRCTHNHETDGVNGSPLCYYKDIVDFDFTKAKVGDIIIDTNGSVAEIQLLLAYSDENAYCLIQVIAYSCAEVDALFTQSADRPAIWLTEDLSEYAAVTQIGGTTGTVQLSRFLNLEGRYPSVDDVVVDGASNHWTVYSTFYEYDTPYVILKLVAKHHDYAIIWETNSVCSNLGLNASQPVPVSTLTPIEGAMPTANDYVIDADGRLLRISSADYTYVYVSGTQTSIKTDSYETRIKALEDTIGNLSAVLDQLLAQQQNIIDVQNSMIGGDN